MDDLVEQGPRDPRGPAGRLRGVATVLLLAAGLFAVAHSDLLSAPGRPPSPDRPLPTPTGTGAGVPAVVLRNGGHLDRYAGGTRAFAGLLPSNLARGARLVPADGLGGHGPLVGSDGSVLFRVNDSRSPAPTSIGRAERVVAAATTPGDVLVLQAFGGPGGRARVVEVDGIDGDVVQAQPFPGFDGRSGWAPVDVVSATEVTTLVLSRPVADGRTELALAWPRTRVVTNFNPPLQRIGVFGDLLGVADDRILAFDRPVASCSDLSCHLRIVSITRDRVLDRPVEPPAGWAFGRAVGWAPTSSPLVEVVRVDDASVRALSRLVAGATSALLVPESVGLLPSYGLAGTPSGSVVFARTDASGAARLALWSPAHPAAAPLLDLPALDPETQIICACS